MCRLLQGPCLLRRIQPENRAYILPGLRTAMHPSANSPFRLAFRIRGQGIPSLRGNGKGDLYVTVTVEIPKRLSEKQKNLLRQFDGTVTGQEYEQKKSFFDRVKEAFGGNS